MINNPKSLHLTTPADKKIVMRRVFDAPRTSVFAALTTPEIVKRWCYGPPEWPMKTCEIDLNVGGAHRYEWRHVDGKVMGMGGVYREIVPPERIVHTELFDEDWTGGETLVTTDLSECDGKTTLTATVLYSSREARDAVLKTGMKEGMAQSYDRLADLLGA